MSNITNEQIRAVFDLFDADGSGFVDTEELGMALQSLGFGILPEEEIETMMRKRDIDENKPKSEYDIDEDDELLQDKYNKQPLPVQLDFVEFRHFVTKYMCKRNSKEEMTKAFYLFAGAATKGNNNNNNEDGENNNINNNIKSDNDIIGDNNNNNEDNNNTTTENPIGDDEYNNTNINNNNNNNKIKEEPIVTIDDLLFVAGEMGEFVPHSHGNILTDEEILNKQKGLPPPEEARRQFLTHEFTQLINYATGNNNNNLINNNNNNLINNNNINNNNKVRGINNEQWNAAMEIAITNKRCKLVF